MKPIRKQRVLLWVGSLLGALLLVVGTWVVASRFQSPEQRAAAASPPPIEPVVVEVTRGDLVEQTTVMATAVREGNRSVPLPTGVVTGSGVSTDTPLRSGEVVLWVNDHPVFALEGRFPLFRDVGEGDSGNDVLMIQEALSAWGCGIFPDGDFGAATADCVRDLYSQVGADAPMELIEEPPSDKSGGAQSGEQEEPSTKKRVVVRMSDFVVVKELPAQVVSVPAVGTTLTGDNAKIGLAGSEVTLSAEVPASVAVKLSTSLRGEVVDGEKTYQIGVASVGVKDTELEKDQEILESENVGSVVEFVAMEDSFPDTWSGRKDLLVSLDLIEPLKDVLLVPARAIAMDSSGVSSVLVQGSDGSFTQVKVVQKDCVGGICVIEDVEGINAGMMVRVDQ